MYGSDVMSCLPPDAMWHKPQRWFHNSPFFSWFFFFKMRQIKKCFVFFKIITYKTMQRARDSTEATPPHPSRQSFWHVGDVFRFLLLRSKPLPFWLKVHRDVCDVKCQDGRQNEFDLENLKVKVIIRDFLTSQDSRGRILPTFSEAQLGDKVLRKLGLGLRPWTAIRALRVSTSYTKLSKTSKYGRLQGPQCPANGRNWCCNLWF